MILTRRIKHPLDVAVHLKLRAKHPYHCLLSLAAFWYPAQSPNPHRPVPEIFTAAGRSLGVIVDGTHYRLHPILVRALAAAALCVG